MEEVQNKNEVFIILIIINSTHEFDLINKKFPQALMQIG